MKRKNWRRLSAILIVLAMIMAMPIQIMAEESEDIAMLETSENNTAVGLMTTEAEVENGDTEFHPEYAYPFQNPNLSVSERVDDIVSRMTLDEKITVFAEQTEGWEAGKRRIMLPRLNYQGFYGADEGLHGVSWLGETTMFPVAIGLSQTWDKDLMQRVGKAVGLENRLLGVKYGGNLGTRGPVVDLLRDPRFGRASEGYGEDAFLTGSLATAWSTGLVSRSDNGYILAAPVLKHFMAYGNEYQRLNTNSSISPRNLNEYYYKSFKYPIEAGAAKGLMTSYNLVNGKPILAMPELKTEVLDKWVPDIEGSGANEFFIETDAGCPQNLTTNNQYFYPDTVDGRAEAMADSILNGMIRTCGAEFNGNGIAAQIYDALARGLLTEDSIDRAARYVMTLSISVGNLDYYDDVNPYKLADGPTGIGTRESNIEKNKGLALEAAQEQIVLLKNDGILPLKGETTNDAVLLGYMGEQVMKDFYAGDFAYTVSIRNALENKLGKDKVSFSRAVDTVGIKASNGQYITASTSANGGNVTANGGTATPTTDTSDATNKRKLFEMYDCGSSYWMIRSVFNDLFLSCSGNLQNNLTAPGERHDWFTYQRLILPKTNDGKTAIYGSQNNHWSVSDPNNGRFYAVSGNNVAPTGSNGPWDTEDRINALAAAAKFDFEVIQSKEASIDGALAGASGNAPVIITLGYDPMVNCSEDLDLYKTGLSKGQKDVIDYVTKTLNRDAILLVKANNPMIVEKEVQNNPRIRAIVSSGHSGQEEGSALVSALFTDGYTGVAPGYEGSIPMYAPAGRLTSTWYEKIEDMPGASTDHRPTSPSTPYNETANDNMDKLNGTTPTGILTYDIIKGERTYQYTNAAPVYAFGHGLTYSAFEYSNLQITGITDESFTLSVDVKNAGQYASDEVVQFYGAYDKSQARKARFEQPHKRLIAYERLKDVAPGETETVTVTVDLTDKLGVWDMTRDMFCVEPGKYNIEAARSSADSAAATAVLTVDGAEIPNRDLTQLTKAMNFDDYSDLDKVELVDCAYDGGTAVQFNKDGAWINFKSADFTGKAPSVFTALVSADRETTISIYKGNPGAGGVLINSAIINDTRPNTDMSPSLALTAAVARNKPLWKLISIDVSALNDVQDIYITSSKRGAGIAWFKFGASPDVTAGVSVQSKENVMSIRKKNGQLNMVAVLDPVTSMDKVVWTVTETDGSATTLATIDQNGTLTSSGAANGYVLVTAASGTESASVDVQITNQLDSDKYVSGSTSHTIEYIMLVNNGGTLGDNTTSVNSPVTDSITQQNGSRQQAVYYKAPEKTYSRTQRDTLPNNMVDWTVTDLDGVPTELATISDTGLLTATGKGNGEVKITATYKNNPDIYTERVMTLQNQEPRSAYTVIEAQNYDSGTGIASPIINIASGNELGLYTNNTNGNVVLYCDIDFAGGADSLYMRKAGTANSSVAVWVDAATAETGGRKIGEFSATTTGSDTVYKTFNADIDKTVTGVHDLYLVFTGAARVTWFQFTGGTVNPTGVTGVSLDKETLDLTVGDTAALTATIEPEDAANKDVVWTSSDEDVATVDSEGNVEGVAPGTATITVTTVDGGLTATCEVTVNAQYVAVESVKIDGAAIQQLRIRNTKQFTATVNPTNATDQLVTWESSNEKIFTVDEEGLVKGVGTGSAKLIVTCGGKTSFIMVQVTA